MKFENTDVWGFEHALRGMRNPMNSWEKSDSGYKTKTVTSMAEVAETLRCMAYCGFEIGENDLRLAQTLIKAGSEHRKFMRQIFVSVDITAPLYWWKEADTYKVGTVANSTSTMHKLASTPITIDCFEMDDFENVTSVDISVKNIWNSLLVDLEELRQKYNETKDKRYWKELLRLLPESWLQTRTITMNYENILNMIHHRSCHKLSEWSKSFIDWTRTLPYAKELLFLEDK